MRTITVEQRRRATVRRHHLDGGAAGPEAVTRALVALHATDPASVYLSVLARSATTTRDDVAAAMYERRRLVRWMAMRRTLFLLPVEDVPMVAAAVSAPLAAALRRALVARMRRNGAEPPVVGDLEAWLGEQERRVEEALRARGGATGAQLGQDVPGLRTVVPARAPSERPQAVTSPLLTIMSTQGRLVRGAPTGPWTSRHHLWEPVERWWPGGVPAMSAADAEEALARRWLERYGPATARDLRWWTGWNKTVTARALHRLSIEEVDLHGEPGIALAGIEPVATPEPVATLLPALDPTPMGWTRREWLFGIDPRPLFDRAGNIGPTLWWDGEIVGGWAVGPAGEVRTALVADRGAEARAAIDDAAARLAGRLAGTVVTPAARTPLERSLVPDH